jgi:hypothetical protein
MKDRKIDDAGIMLTPGSTYRIKSLESRESPLITHGKFLGYTAIAHDEGVCVELDSSHKEFSGQVRVIPVHVIISIDIIKAAEKEEKSTPDSGTMFG